MKIGDKDKHILNLVKKFYQIILDYIIPKKKNGFKQEKIKLFMTKNQKEDVVELLKNIDNGALKYMKLSLFILEIQ